MVSDVMAFLGLTWLEKADLTSTQTFDLSPLAGLASLEELFLLETQVNDVTPLLSLTSLKLYLSKVPLSQESAEQLRTALP